MYEYSDLKPTLFTDAGQRQFLQIRDHVHKVLETAGAIRMGNAMEGNGSSWERMACVDRLVELGEIREIDYGHCATQHRIFVKA